MSIEGPSDRLARRLSTSDAVIIGLGSMLGAGVFAAVAPAAAAAGGAMLYSLLAAGVVAYLNATSSAQLAAIYPMAGGSYVYGKERLGDLWGYLAGWGFIVGKVASCAVMALTFGSYAYPPLARPLAVAAVIFVGAINYRGVTKTAGVTKLTVSVVVLTLLAITVGSLLGGPLEASDLVDDLVDPSALGVLQAAGLLFFAFAGYARIATLGEEVINPSRTIPIAIPLSLVITLALYSVVSTSALLAIGPEAVAGSAAPLADAVGRGDFAWLAPLSRIGAAIACLGVLLSLFAGVSRTTLAMARDRRLPHFLAAIHPRFQVPHRAEIVVAIAISLLVVTTDFRSAIGFSSFLVLAYYAITNASALTLPSPQRRWPKAYSAVGFLGCILLASTLPTAAVLSGLGVLAVGLFFYLIQARRAGLRL